VDNIRRDIYECKVNGLIPWALIAGAGEWLGSDGKYADGSMDKALLIKRDGSLVVSDLYYFYKQVSRAGQPGMQVAEVINLDPALGAIAFKAEEQGQRDAIVLVNKNDEAKEVTLHIQGGSDAVYEAFRTGEGERYRNLGEMKLSAGILRYNSPPRSVTTFFGQK
jgi:hypothetical protein